MPALSIAETVVVSDDMPTRLEDPALTTVVAPANGRVPDVSVDSIRYVLLGEVGRGGMGTVHVARDLELMRRVALKQLTLGAAADSARRRFLREVQITAQLDHPNVVPVYSLENSAGAPAYAMKLVEGRTFAAFLRETAEFYRRGETPDDAHALPVRIEHFLKVCDALAYAHDKGVIHRDLKPANLMLGRHNEVYVMDWGICRVISAAELETAISTKRASDDVMTAVGDVMGTPAYMSPEQARGRNDSLDARSDQCALGLILYELVTLGRPFDGATPLEVLSSPARGAMRPVEHAYGDTIPRELIAIVNKATAPNPADRYPDVQAMADDLRRAARGEAVLARPDTVWQRAQRAIVRHRQAALVGLLAIAAAAALAVLGVFYVQEERLRAAELRERREDALVASVSRRANVLQERFVAVQDELESLAAAAGRLVEFGSVLDRKFYWARDFRDEATRAAVTVSDPRYGAPVSFDYGSWIPAPDAREAELEPKVRRLMGLRALRNDLFSRARDALVEPSAATNVATSTVHRLVMALADGVTLRFPGDALAPDDYDGRAEPWYAVAGEPKHPVWGTSFVDRGDRTRVLPVSFPLVDEMGARLGVAAFLVSTDAIARSLAHENRDLGATETLLVDGDGKVVSSSRASRATMTAFADRALLRAIEEHEVGTAKASADGEEALAVFDRLHSLGWTLVAIVPASRLE